MDNELEIIGIDHGWSMMKTVTRVFASGVKEITSVPALYENTLEYAGKYYRVGNERNGVIGVKVLDENFYLLTLAAIAMELKRRGKTEAKVFIAAGLPLTRFGAEKADFLGYLTKNEEVTFCFENIKYHINIVSAAVFPQCYSAVADRISTYTKKTLIVDIGSWTIDIMPVANRMPDESKCITIQEGLITCMRSINEQYVRQLNGAVDESEIQNIMRYGNSDLDDAYQEIAVTEITAFCERVFQALRESKYNLQTTPIVFCGGGATVMKNFGKCDQKNISYIFDVKANARGYEQLAEIGLRNKRKIS